MNLTHNSHIIIYWVLLMIMSSQMFPLLLKNILYTLLCIGYVDPVNPTKLFETAVSAMLKVRRKKWIKEEEKEVKKCSVLY